MKRSEINAIIRRADSFIREQGFHLPPFAYWSPEDWASKGPEVREIVDHGLGWDVSDFGSGDFGKRGLLLFTIRNGHPGRPEGKTYAEKVMVVEQDQETPMHFHWKKAEDIINRGGAQLAVELYRATADETLDGGAFVEISTDGVARRLKPGAVVELSPGESITLTPRVYHRFWGQGGRVLLGEVSSVNDDRSDNRFLQPVGRFPAITENEPPLHLLVTDYKGYYAPR